MKTMQRRRKRRISRSRGGRDPAAKAVAIAAVTLVAILVGVDIAAGQGVMAREQVCASGVLEGNLGVSGLDCVGECSIVMNPQGGEERWEFSTEPRIFSIETGGPADGVLRSGDFLAAIDGLLITTREGGIRYANLQPGEVVAVRFRRDGRVQEATIRVGSRCRPTSAFSTGRFLPSPPPRPADAKPSVGILIAPRVRVLPDTAPVVEPRGVAPMGMLPGGGLLDSTPRGRLGIGLSCSRCGTETDPDTGESIWFFSGPIEVTHVNTGGPAEMAGIRMGDLITAIEGHAITTEKGGVAFSRLTPGEAVTVTVIKRNGQEVEFRVVPAEPEAPLGVASVTPPVEPGRPDPVRPSVGVAVAPLPPPAVGVDVPEPEAGAVEGPETLPLSYSGTVAGVEVVVRGGPVAVSELKGTRTLIINAEGIWVRIRVPAGTVRE